MRLHSQQPTRLPSPWDSPGNNTGVGCHFPLQCTKVKSQSEVAQLCPTLSDLMDCSLPGSSVHGIFQARVLEWGAIAFSKLSTAQHQVTEAALPLGFPSHFGHLILGPIPDLSGCPGICIPNGPLIQWKRSWPGKQDIQVRGAILCLAGHATLGSHFMSLGLSSVTSTQKPPEDDL